MPESAELILHGGDVFTGDANRPHARALAISGGRITAVGDDAEVMAQASAGTQVVNLNGRAVLPALSDGHAHLLSLGIALGQADLRGCSAPEDCAARAVRAAAGRPPGEWVLGRGWDQNRFADKQFPTRNALDRVLGARPVWLRRIDGHAGWANGRALELAGVTRATPDPPGGRIIRDARGEPTGVLIDAAQGLVERAVPPASAEARERAILSAQEVVLSYGLTCVHEMGIDEQSAALYRRLDNQRRLTVRVHAFASGGGAAENDRLLARAPDQAQEGAVFALRGIKLYADGALGSRGAALLAPYADDPKNSGLVITKAEEIERVARRALATGWQVAVHAIGDRANRMTLEAFERAGCTAARDHRFRIEHAQVVAPEDIPRFARLGVTASMQPTHATSDMPWAEERLGRARLAGAYAWQRFLHAGVRIVGGSDFPVEEVDPVRGGLYAAVTRQDASGRPSGGWLPEQRMTLEQAIRAFTFEPAWSAFQERWRGRAAVGQVADLTVLDRGLGGDPAPALREARVALTIVAGRVVYRARGAPPIRPIKL